VTATIGDANYLIWEADSQSNYCVLGYLQGYSDDYKLMKGDSVATEWPDVSMRMDPDFKKQIKLSDNLLNPVNVIVASKRLCDFFRSKGVPNIEYLPVTIYDHKKKVASKEYSIANLVTTQDCIDTKKSEVTWNAIDSDYISSMKRLVLNEKKIAKDAMLFRAEHLKELIFVRADLAQAVTDAGFTNIKFWKLSDYK
jgi:hypothetical protein